MSELRRPNERPAFRQRACDFLRRPGYGCIKSLKRKGKYVTNVWWRPLVAAIITVAAAAAAASPALASGTLSVGVAGAGTVSGGGISCTRSALGATSGICAKTFTDTQVCDPEIKPPVPPSRPT